MSNKKSFFIKLSCALGAFVLGFAFAVMPFFSSKASYAMSSTFIDNNNMVTSYFNDWHSISRSVSVNDRGYYTDSVNLYTSLSTNQNTSILTDWTISYYSFDNGVLSYNQSTLTAGFSTAHVTFYNLRNVWTDNLGNYYYSLTGTNRKIDFANLSLTTVTFTGLTSFAGYYVWSDFAGNTFYSLDGDNYKFDPDTLTWTPITFSGYNLVSGHRIWFDNLNNVYFTNQGNNYRFDSDTLTWTPVTFTGLTSFNGYYVFNNGVNVYYVYRDLQYVLDVNTLTWTPTQFYVSPIEDDNTVLVGSNMYFYKGLTILAKGFSSLSDAFNYSSFYDYGYKIGYALGYNAGLSGDSSSDSSFDLGYNAGYSAGVATNSGFNAGYAQGYNVGYNTGYAEGDTEGYNSGYSQGNTEGYNTGYAEGVEDSNEYTFLGLMGAVIDAPIQAFTNLFNFEIFGTNIKNLLLALFTGSIIVVTVKFALGGK